MNHQPFREWIVSEEKLSAEQLSALEVHLKSCEACCQLNDAWSEVESALRQPTEFSPRPDFTARWQAHLAEYQQSRQKTRLWTSMGVSFVIIATLLAIIVTQLWTFIQAPDQYVAIWLNSLVSLLSVYYTLAEHVNLGTTYMPIYTIVGMFFLVGMICFMSVLWLAAYRKLSMSRRTV